MPLLVLSQFSLARSWIIFIREWQTFRAGLGLSVSTRTLTINNPVVINAISSVLLKLRADVKPDFWNENKLYSSRWSQQFIKKITNKWILHSNRRQPITVSHIQKANSCKTVGFHEEPFQFVSHKRARVQVDRQKLIQIVNFM